MIKKQLLFLCLLLGLLLCSLPAFATDTGIAADQVKVQPLDQLLETSSIIPYPFYGNAFVNGNFSDAYKSSNYQLYQQQDRVLAPVRLAADVLSNHTIHWHTEWLPESQTIQLKGLAVQQIGNGFTTIDSPETTKTATITIGKNTMQVNGQQVQLEVPAQTIDGYTVLPLRALGEALDQEVTWLDNVIIFSGTPVDPNAPGTKTTLAQVKPLLLNPQTDTEHKNTPVAAYQGGWYSKQATYDVGGALQNVSLVYTKDGVDKTYPLADGATWQTSRLNNTLYYTAKLNGSHWLYRFDFDSNQSSKVCSLTAEPVQWQGNNNWLVAVKEFGGSIYVLLHDGDNSMGNGQMFRLVNNQLEPVFSANSITSLVYDNQKFFYTDYLVNSAGDNLYVYDLAKGGQPVTIGQDTYNYEIHPMPEVESGSSAIEYPADALPNQLQEGYLYLTGYDINQGQLQRQLFKLNTETNQLTKLPMAVKAFWLWNKQLVYIDGATGHLRQTDLDGQEGYTLVKENLSQAKIYKNDLYYTLEGQPGLYHYNLSGGKIQRLTDMPVSNYFCNKAGVFAINSSAQPGIYKLENGNVTCLDSGFIQNALDTDLGVLYNKKYAAGCFLAK